MTQKPSKMKRLLSENAQILQFSKNVEVPTERLRAGVGLLDNTKLPPQILTGAKLRRRHI